MVKKTLIVIFIALIVTGVFAGINFLNLKQSGESKQTIIPTQKTGVEINIFPSAAKGTEQTAPLPSEEDIIRNFFISINEKRIPEAISMMTSKMVGDDSSKQAWGVQFNSFKSVRVLSIEPSMKEEWSNDSHTYKVSLNVEMKPDSAKVPIPFYGWDNGKNIRWVPITKISSLWKISGIATGP